MNKSEIELQQFKDLDKIIFTSTAEKLNIKYKKDVNYSLNKNIPYKSSNFKQQNLHGYFSKYIVNKIYSKLICYLSLSIIFFIIAIILTIKNKKAEQIFDYTEGSKNLKQQNVITQLCNKNENCSIPKEFTINDDKFKQKLQIMYQIDNFFQSHRELINKRNNKQLKGKEVTIEQLKKSQCKDILYINQLYDWQIELLEKNRIDQYKHINKTQTPLSEEQKANMVANPCGNFAKLMFYDQQKIEKQINETWINIPISENNLVLKQQISPNNYFNSVNWKNDSWIDKTNERFISWMIPSSLPNFRKMFGKIENGLEKGNQRVIIQHHTNLIPFGSKKSFVITGQNLLQSNNKILAVVSFITAIFTSIICLFVTVQLRSDILNLKYAINNEDANVSRSVGIVKIDNINDAINDNQTISYKKVDTNNEGVNVKNIDLKY